MARNYRYISADSHLEVPPDRWAHRVPDRFAEYAPRRVTLPNGGDAFKVGEGGRMQRGGMNLYSGNTPEDFFPVGVRWDDCPGTGPAEQRLSEQDRDGIDAEVLYPGPGSRSLLTGVKDNDAYRALLRAYNEWLAEEYCAVAPDRLIGLGLLPDRGVDDAIDEMLYCKELGLKGVDLISYPAGNTYPTVEDDRFWSAAVDAEMPVSIHVAVGGVRAKPDFKYPMEPSPEQNPNTDLVERTTRYARAGGVNAVQMVVAGLFDRVPKLKLYLAENQIGWLPHFFEQLDNNYVKNCHWAQKLFGVPVLERPPSEYIKEHCYWGFMYDPVGVRLRHDVGVDHIMWSTDFPHIESDWPNSMNVIEETFAGVPEDEKRRMVAGNCIEFFKLGGA